MTGGVVSTTVTSKRHVAVLPGSSVAVQQVSVVSEGNVAPEVGVHETGTHESHESVAVTVKSTRGPPSPVHSAIMSPEHVMTGGVVSAIVTSNEHPAALFASSVAVRVTVVVPRVKSEPEAGAQPTVGVGAQSSVAVKTNVTVAPPGPVNSTVPSPGRFGTGVRRRGALARRSKKTADRFSTASG